jgi:DNA helicase-2/ATP-dependent DNA helicase PcrA
VKVKANWQASSADARKLNADANATATLSEPKEQKSKRSTKHSQDWKVGDLLIHDTFGTGEVSHVFGSGNKISIAVKFPSLGQKILDPKRTTLKRVD